MVTVRLPGRHAAHSMYLRAPVPALIADGLHDARHRPRGVPISMKIPTSILTAGLVAALVLPVAADAAATTRGTPQENPSLSVLKAIGGLTLHARASTATPKTTVKPKTTKPRPDVLSGQVILPFVALPTSVSGPGNLENCASYLGCTDDEYCQTWGERCDLVDAPVGTRTRSSQGSDTTW